MYLRYCYLSNSTRGTIMLSQQSKSGKKSKKKNPEKQLELLTSYFTILEKLLEYKSYGGKDCPLKSDQDSLETNLKNIRKKLDAPTLDADIIRVKFMVVSNEYQEQLTAMPIAAETNVINDDNAPIVIMNIIDRSFKEILLCGGIKKSSITVDSRFRQHCRLLSNFFIALNIILEKRRFTSYWQAILAYGNLKYFLIDFFNKEISKE